MVVVIHRRAEDGYVSVAFFLAARTWEGQVVNAEPQSHDELVQVFLMKDLDQILLLRRWRRLSGKP